MRKEKEKKDRRIRLSTAKFIAVAAAVSVFILTFSFSYAWGAYENQIEERANTDVFATLDLEDFDENPVTIDELAGTKLVAFNVWETTCPACLGEMGALEELSKEYDPSRFRLIGMCADLYDANGKLKPEQLEKARELMKDAGVTFPNLVPDQGFQDFFRSTIAGFPTTFFVDGEGNILDVTTGARDLKTWEEYVNGQLQKLE